MKLTLSDGRVFDTPDPSHRLTMLELQESLEAFRQACDGLPYDKAHAAYGELMQEARDAAERCVRAFDGMREMLVSIGAGEEASNAMAAGPMSEVRRFLHPAEPESND